MPELPDLLYITTYLQNAVAGRTITGVAVTKPVILRQPKGESVDWLTGKKLEAVGFRGPFLRFTIDRTGNLIVNLMLSGKLQHQRTGEKSESFRCFSLLLDDGSRLNVCDQKMMAKVYFITGRDLETVPGYEDQGIDILSDQFTLDVFCGLLEKHRRKQVRVFLIDRKALRAIGNAYADEVLFEAGIHPKSFIGKLTPEQGPILYEAIRKTLSWGVEKVRKAGEPIHVKVRDHMKVRNRRGKPCLRCGSTIRREGVRGYDVYFCPKCQPSTRDLFLDWKKIS